MEIFQEIFTALKLTLIQKYINKASSLHDLSIVLKANYLNSIVLRITLDPNVPCIFPALVLNNGTYYIINTKDSNYVYVRNIKSNIEEIYSYLEFHKKFGNEILFFQKVLSLPKLKYDLQKKIFNFSQKYFWHCLLIILIIFSIIILLNDFKIQNILYLLILFIGLTFSVSLQMKIMGINSIVFDSLCSENNKCLNSLTPWWVHYYFIASSLTIFLGNIISLVYFDLIKVLLFKLFSFQFIVLTSLIIILISLFIQVFVEKAFCRVCIIITFLILLFIS